MKFASTILTTFSTMGALFVSGAFAAEAKSSGLRGLVESTVDSYLSNHRGALATLDLDTIAVCLEPVLAAAIGAALEAELDPLTLNLDATTEFESIKFHDGCTSAATLNIKVIDISGLGTCNLLDDKAVVLVDDSEDISCSITGGCGWSVDVAVEAGFLTGLESLVDIELVAEGCGVHKSISGAVVAPDALLKLLLTASGSIVLEASLP